MDKKFKGVLIFLLIVGVLTGGTLFLSGETSSANKGVQNKAEIGNMQEMTGKTNENTLPKSNQTQSKEANKQSIQVINRLEKEFDDGTKVTITHYGDEQDQLDHTWEVKVVEENLPKEYTKDQALEVVNDRYAAKEIEEVQVNDMKALMDYTSSKGEGLNELWIPTDHSFYSISAPHFTKEELLIFASSLEFVQ